MSRSILNVSASHLRLRLKTDVCLCTQNFSSKAGLRFSRAAFDHGLISRNLKGISTSRLAALKDAVEAPSLEPSEASEIVGKINTEASASVLESWKKAHCVCFDVDCTITKQDSLDLLAEYMGKGKEVADLTNQAMNGSLSLEQALEERLNIINCTPTDLQNFIRDNPPESRLTPGIKTLISALQARGVAVYLISGGFREMTLPIAKVLGVPFSNVFANRMNWQADDVTGVPTKLVGFDTRELTAHQGGKPQAIARLREMFPYETVVMVGDGITDLEAVSISGGADIFIGYGGVVVREAVAQGADWFVYDFSELSDALRRYKVAFIGSGAWACAAVRMVARNCLADDPADEFVDEVKMWVYEEELEEGKLTDIINARHENPKYLPGVQLGDNVLACPNLEETVAGADVLMFCCPHQFIHGICKQLRGKVNPDAIAISLTKGMRVRPDGPQLISEMVRKYLGIDCSVLMGPNIAGEIARDQLSEATIGYNIIGNGIIFQKLFETDNFNITLVPDAAGAEMAGTLKNIVALAAGFIDGLGLGPNSKATIMRAGLQEMRRFAKQVYPTIRDDTLFESCGVADLIATCYGGRNRMVAQQFVVNYLAGTPKTFMELEAELLKGQKLQGVLTSSEVQEVLKVRGWEVDFPLFTTVNRIATGKLPPTQITNYRKAAVLPLPDDDELAGQGNGLVNGEQKAPVVRRG